ncbi:MAG: transporter substrate-binding domain-containing protein [Alteromonadaceae bacterium]
MVEQYVAQYVIENIYNYLGLKIKVIPLPPKRAKTSNLNKSIDGEIARITPYGDDKPSLTRIEPSYYYLESAAYCLKDSTLKITSANDLIGLKVASIRGVAHSNEATANLKNVHKVDSAIQLFELLKHKRAEVVIDTEINGRRILQQDRYLPFSKNCGVFARFGLYNYINDNRKEVSYRVSSKREELHTSGELEKLIRDAELKALLLGPEYF